MKKLTLLVAALCATASLFAVEPKVTLGFTSSSDPWKIGTTKLTVDSSFTNGSYTIHMVADKSNGYKINSYNSLYSILFGKQNSALQLPAFDFDVARIVVYGNTNGSAKTTLCIHVGGVAVSDTLTSSKVTQTFDIASEKQVAGTIYSLVVCNANNANIDSIEIYEAVAGAPENPVFSIAAGTYTSAQSVELTCATEGAKIYYTLDGTDPTDASTEYAAAIAVDATTTIKAVAIKDGVASTIIEKIYTIVELEGEGTKDNPYTATDIVKLNNAVASTGVWVAGYIVGAYNSGTIETTTTVTANILIAASAEETNKANMVCVQLPTSQAELAAALNLKDNASNLGAKVKVYGDLLTYNTLPGVKNTSDYVLEKSDPTAIESLEVAPVIYGANGMIYGAEEARIYNISGMDVTEMNGSLRNGVYVVKVNGKAHKVVVK